MRYLAGVAVLATLAAVALASPPARSADAPDATFAAMAGQGGVDELQMVAVAIRKSRNQIVIDYARLMRADHTKNNSQLNAIALKEHWPRPINPSPAGQATIAKLQGLSDADFNRGYLSSQVDAHTQMLAVMQNEIANGRDAELQAFAKMTLPVVQQHLALAQKDLATPAAMPNPM